MTPRRKLLKIPYSAPTKLAPPTILKILRPRSHFLVVVGGVLVLLLVFGVAYAIFFEEVNKLTASDGVEDDEFGWSVDIDSEWAIVAAPGDNENGLQSGSVYIIKRGAGGQ